MAERHTCRERLAERQTGRDRQAERDWQRLAERQITTKRQIPGSADGVTIGGGSTAVIIVAEGD